MPNKNHEYSVIVKDTTTRTTSSYYLQDVENDAIVDTIKLYSLHKNLNPWYNSYHVNEYANVEHGKKSLNYHPLMYVVN